MGRRIYKKSDDQFFADFRPMLLFHAEVAIIWPDGKWTEDRLTVDFKSEQFIEKQAKRRNKGCLATKCIKIHTITPEI